MTLNGVYTLYYCPEGSAEVDNVLNLKSSGIPFITATVPGNVELDLSNAGILPKDLYKGENIIEAEKFELYQWWYEKTFVAPREIGENQDLILHFSGVDCFADYYLNGEKIGSSDNMFISYDFNVTDKIKLGEENTLTVHISSAIIKGSEYYTEPNTTAYSWHQKSVAKNVRKAPHSYGWDIMPRAVSAGIWRDVELNAVDKYGFKYLYFKLNNLGGEVTLMFDSTLPYEQLFKDKYLKITGRCGDSYFESVTRDAEMIKCSASSHVFTIPDIKLWWPKGYGEANIYDITVELLTEDKEVIISKTVKRGFRTLKLRHSEIVEKGGAFEFVINGKRIMAVGTNWVPMDVYHSRDKERYQKALDLANDLGCNIIRCWGGNVYEDHQFFDYCDSHGMMVWQDFAMACQYYPQNEDFAAKLRAEAQWVVKELRDHPSLVLWCGDNEIDSMLAMSAGVNPAENHLTREVLPRVIERLDPFRPYIASSPYISEKAFGMGANFQGNPYYPEDHLWGPRDYYKSEFFKGSGAYFVSEIGYMGCPSKSSLERFIDKEYLWPYFNNKQWNLHSSDQRHNGCWDNRTMLMHKQVKELFGEAFEDMEDFILASQISQAEAKKFFIENMRRQMARNGGIIWWNLIDGWPQISDAVVDYYYDKKLAYDFIKRSQKPFIIMLEEMTAWGHNVVTANNTLKELKGRVKITDLDSKEVFFEADFTTGPNCNKTLGKLPLMYSDKGMFLIEWELAGGEKGFNTYLYGSPKYSLEQYKGWLKRLSEIR